MDESERSGMLSGENEFKKKYVTFSTGGDYIGVHSP